MASGTRGPSKERKQNSDSKGLGGGRRSRERGLPEYSQASHWRVTVRHRGGPEWSPGERSLGSWDTAAGVPCQRLCILRRPPLTCAQLCQLPRPCGPATSLSGQLHLPSRSGEPVLTLKLSAPLSRQQFSRPVLLTAHCTGEGQLKHRQCMSKVIWR